MKIAIINNLYQPYNKGGAEKNCQKLINEAQAQGHDCFIITTKPKKETKINYDPRTYYLPSNYYFLKKTTIIYRLFWQIANIFNFFRGPQLKKILITEKPDIIITHNLMGIGIRSFKIIKKLKIKQIHILHDIQLFYPSGLMFYGQEKKVNSLPAKLYQLINRNLVGSPDLIVSPSKWLLTEHTKRKFFESSHKIILKNPVDNTRENNIERNIPKNKYTFLFIGQIELHKGILFLINTFKKIPNDNIILNIVGQGSLLNQAKKIAQTDKRINFLGFNNDIEIEQLKTSDCLIVPSWCYENSPTVIYNALNYNLPIIASNLGGIPELFTNQSGLLFTPKDELDLINKINEYLNNPTSFIYNKKPVETGYLTEILKNISRD
ncbi:MAG TPA: glycosyltransferase [bacterium]|nr:glycosyltransferase [bacterium]